MNEMAWTDLLVGIFTIAGALVIFLSALGVLRLPDIYCRSHALAKSLPLGINLMLIGMWIHIGGDTIGFKTFLAILFQAVSIPAGGQKLPNNANAIIRVLRWDSH